MSTVTELFNAALTLPEAERAELADLLAATSASPPIALHPAWQAEVRKRAAEIDSGAVRPIPWDDVLKEIRIDLDENAR